MAIDVGYVGAVGAGAVSFLMKDRELDEIVAAIRSAAGSG